MRRLLLLPLAALCLFSMSNAQPNLTGGLLAYYPFYGNTNDQSGNGRHGTINGSASLTTDRFGTPNNAYHFSAGSILSHIPHNIEDNYAVNAWFKANGSGVQTIFYWRDIDYLKSTAANINNGDSQIGGYWAEGNYDLGCLVGYGCTNQYWQTKEYGDGQWHMVTICKSGDELRLYVDATLLATEPVLYYCDYFSGIISTEFSINTNDTYSDLHGSIDDVMVYGRILTAYEISYIYYLPHSWVSPLAAPGPEKVAFCEMYPNPTKDITNFSFSSPKSYELRVFDNMGKEVARQSTHGLTHELNTSGWATGVYSVLIQDASGNSQTLRLVKN